MADAWDKKVFEFLKKTGDEIKSETQRLIEEVKDPEKQQKLKAGLKDISVWAKKTAEEAAELVEGAYRKAEETVRTNVGGPAATPPKSAPAKTAEAPRAAKPAGAKKPVKKTVGKKKSTPSAAPAASKPKAAKKTLGKKRS